MLVVADATAPPAHVPVLDEMRRSALVAPIELVLLCPEGEPSPHTLSWREHIGARAHYFLHPWDELDVAAVARQVTGRGVGLVFGGGGARGFAHIGLVRALEQLDIPIDVTGGTSMGAFVAALVACGFDSVRITQVVRQTFVNRNYLNDYTLPKVSLIRGQRFFERLQEIFGERRIEDLRRTFFCVSSNLTTGAPAVHDRGHLASWVATSMAVPGIAPPIAYRGDLLCDGALVDTLPTGVLQSLERGSIIACAASTEGDLRAPQTPDGGPDNMAVLRWSGPERAPRLTEILLRTATFAGQANLRQAAERADLCIRMPVEDVHMFAWNQLDAIVERGYEHALAVLAPLRDRLVG